jgi:hypothetical protein
MIDILTAALSRPARACALVMFATPALAGAGESPAYCTEPGYRALDFWAGDWDAFDYPVAQGAAARVIVTKTLGGCAIHEQYDGASGFSGRSYSIYDPTRGLWHQTWVTGKGELLLLEGPAAKGKVTLTAHTQDAGGHAALMRATWWKDAVGVHERGESSSDDGRSWKEEFNLLFRAHAPTAPAKPRRP